MGPSRSWEASPNWNDIRAPVERERDTHVCVYIYIYTHIYIYVCVYAYAYVYVYVYVSVYACRGHQRMAGVSFGFRVWMGFMSFA